MSVSWKYRHILWSFLILNFWAVSGNAALDTDPAIIFEVEDKSWVLNVQRGLLDDLVDHIYQDFQLEILGLETRKRETITLSLKGKTLADIARGLLQYLGEKNFAFEFENDRLKRVLVLPEANVDIRNLSFAIFTYEGDQGQSINAVEIQGIIDGSQAKKLNLRKGDLIVEYDGLKITRATELIEATKKRSFDEDVEILLLRNGDFFPLRAKGGFIGIQVKTIKIFKEELEGSDGRF